MTRIALYSGATILAKGLDSILRHDGTFELLPPCLSLDRLMAQIANDAPEIILLDHSLAVTFAVVAEIKHAARGAKLVLWVDTITTQMAMQALEVGIRGILRKRLPIDLHLMCLTRVQAGGVWFEKTLTEPSPTPARIALTGREEQLVSLLSQGLKNFEIAGSLAITEGTVRIYLSQLYQKLGVKDRFELALFGLKHLASKPGAAAPVPPFPSATTVERRPEDGASKGLPLPLVPTLQ
jgi:two-component system, NarL family, nitrate/nitrite response regulator NarL